MTFKTVHVFPSEDGQWEVRKEGQRGTVYARKGEAIASATKRSNRQRAGQVVIHEKSGRLSVRGRHGLPVIQSPVVKSKLGSKRIAAAVSEVTLKRLRASD